MREILFKAKRKDNGEWVEGYYRRIPCMGMLEHYIMPRNPKNRMEQYAIDPDTLCQYTGLKDEKGKKIWENDIVKVSTNKGNLCEVRYADNVAQFQLWQFTTLPGTATVLNLGNYEEKVIGNIFDNAGLLEVE